MVCDKMSEDPFFQDLEHHVAAHALSAARRACASLGGPLNRDNLDRFLTLPGCLRYPTAIVFDAAPLEPHQFAEPVIVVENGARVCRLHLHPHFAERPDALPHLVAYMAAAINYGAVATPELCEAFGAALMGVDRETFYGLTCEFADELAA